MVPTAIVTTLMSPISVGHSVSLEPMLNLCFKFSVGHINCLSRKWMWVHILIFMLLWM